MRPSHQEFADGLKLAAIAAVSAVLAATVVIGAGRTLVRQTDVTASEWPVLTRVALR